MFRASALHLCSHTHLKPLPAVSRFAAFLQRFILFALYRSLKVDIKESAFSVFRRRELSGFGHIATHCVLESVHGGFGFVRRAFKLLNSLCTMMNAPKALA
jgi:hypothetical protein